MIGAIVSGAGVGFSIALIFAGSHRLWFPRASPDGRVRYWPAGVTLLAGALAMIVCGTWFLIALQRPTPPGPVAYTGRAIPAGSVIYISSGTASCAVGPNCDPKSSVCVVRADGKAKCEPQ